MKIYILAEGQSYNGESQSTWQLLDLPLEDCIKCYSGKRTLMLTWEVDNLLHSIHIYGHDDITYMARKLANNVTDAISKKFGS